MKHWVKTFPYTPTYQGESFFSKDTLAYDIETTGLSAKNNHIYLIGCCYRKDTQVVVSQFFAENKEQEKEILIAFFSLLSTFRQQMTFNGIRFDTPFIEERAKKLHLDTAPLSIPHFDIYKACRSLKKLLNLPSCRQKAIEEFLGIHREDIYSGGDLIPIYHTYTKTSDEQDLALLKLHNYEDVTGMLSLLPILTYQKLFTASFHLTSAKKQFFSDYQKNKKEELEVLAYVSETFPASFRLTTPYGYFLFQNNLVKGILPLHAQTLKHFLSNHKDYVYLPNEEMLLLKELADYIPKGQKIAATPDTCFLQKEDLFIQVPPMLPLDESSVLFKKERKDKSIYLSFSDLNFDENFFNHFLHSILLEYEKKSGQM